MTTLRRPRSIRPRPVRPHAARSRSGVALAAAVALGMLTGAGCRAAGSDPFETDPAARAARIEALERAIAEDHATLSDLITRPGAGETRPIYEEPEMRRIGERLTDQESELARLVKIRNREATQRLEDDGS